MASERVLSSARYALGVCLCAYLLPITAVAADSTIAGCEALANAAQKGIAAQIQQDDETIKQPQSVTKFTCLGNFFNGVGLNVLTSGLDIGSIAQAAAGQICAEVTNTWNSLAGTAQCGLTISGLNSNFDLGLGTGTYCPSLNFGGGGSSLLTAGTNTSGNTQWTNGGATQLPDGYSLSLMGDNTGISVMQ